MNRTTTTTRSNSTRSNSTRSNSTRNNGQRAKRVASAAQAIASAQIATPVATPVELTPRQRAADAGHALAGVLSHDGARRVLQSAIGNVKRSDLLSKADDINGRTLERIERADVAKLASMLATAADALATLASTPVAELRGANVSVRIGSVSALALLAAIADANSKADALSQFASK